MRINRRWRNFVNQLVGVQGDLQIWWTPELPLIYVDNPKAGCSTIKYSLKEVQADAFLRNGQASAGQRAASPHTGDDCLRRRGLAPRACRQRYLISCVRNPFTRALSGYLDKVHGGEPELYPELHNRDVSTFEAYLSTIADYPERDLDRHFRPQCLNLDFPRLSYDAIFFLENLAPLSDFLTHFHGAFRLKTFAPHSRKSSDKLRQHYTDRAICLVREIYARDFAAFGYSTEIEDTGTAPGEMISAGKLVRTGSGAPQVPERPVHATPGLPLETTLRYRQLIDMRLL